MLNSDPSSWTTAKASHTKGTDSHAVCAIRLMQCTPQCAYRARLFVTINHLTSIICSVVCLATQSTERQLKSCENKELIPDLTSFGVECEAPSGVTLPSWGGILGDCAAPREIFGKFMLSSLILQHFVKITTVSDWSHIPNENNNFYFKCLLYQVVGYLRWPKTVRYINMLFRLLISKNYHFQPSTKCHECIWSPSAW